MEYWRGSSKWRPLFAACAVLLLLLPVWAVGQEDERSVIRVAYTHFPPYSQTREDGQAEGLAIDLARRLAEAEGYEPIFFQADNPGDMMAALENGTADMTALLALTPGRLERAPGTEELGAFRSSLFARRGPESQVTADFAEARIGVVRGSFGVKTVRDALAIDPVELPNIDALLLALLSNEVDAISVPYGSFQSYLRARGIDPIIEAVEPYLSTTPFGFFVSPDRPDLLAALNRQIGTGFTQADFDALSETWFGAPTRLREHETLFWQSVGLAASLVLAVVALLRWWFLARRSHMLRLQNEENRLFIDALDGIDTAVVIYGNDLRAVHWNAGFAREFPHLLAIVEKGGSLRDILLEGFVSGSLLTPTGREEALQLSQALLDQVHRSESVWRQMRLANGKVFEANDFRIGQAHFASVRIDVTRSHKQAALIETQKGELEAANKHLEMFSTVAAHDLKAPLLQQASLLRFIQEDIDQAGIDIPETVPTYFDMMERLAEKMSTLIEDLLDYARCGSKDQDTRALDPNTRMEAVIETAGLPHRFVTAVSPDMPAIRVAPASFDTVMRNLISNAAKHHERDDGTVTITARRLGAWVEIRIEDDGKGIPEALQPKIFEPFTRLTSDSDGSGLGLSFVKKSVIQWGGEIRVESDGKNGTAFILTVPAAEAVELPVLDKAVFDVHRCQRAG